MFRPTQKNLTTEELEVLRAIGSNKSILNPPRYTPEVAQRLLELRLVRQTLGGTLAITDDGFVAAFPEIIIRRNAQKREQEAARAKKKQREQETI